MVLRDLRFGHNTATEIGILKNKIAKLRSLKKKKKTSVCLVT